MERTQRKQHLVTVMKGTEGGVTAPSVAQRTAGPPDQDRDRLRSSVVPERDGLCSHCRIVLGSGQTGVSQVMWGKDNASMQLHHVMAEYETNVISEKLPSNPIIPSDTVCAHCLCTGLSCCCSITKLCPTLCDPVDCSLPGFSVYGISQARILEWVAISFSSRAQYMQVIPLTFCLSLSKWLK